MQREGVQQSPSPGTDGAAPARDIAVVLAVDGELLATGLALALSTRPQLHLVAVARSVAQAYEAVSRHHPTSSWSNRPWPAHWAHAWRRRSGRRASWCWAAMRIWVWSRRSTSICSAVF